MLGVTIHPWSSAILFFIVTQAASKFQGLNASVTERHPAERSRYHNLTNAELSELLKNEGYNVVELANEPPLVQVDDVVSYPEQVIPGLVEGRSASISDKELWVHEGVAQVRYFFDNESTSDKYIFSTAVKTWSDSTCIQFKRFPDAPCKTKLDHGSLCIGNYEGCWSHFGNKFQQGGWAQKMSVQRGVCDVSTTAHEFGHALGANHQQSRPDRDAFITVHVENIGMQPDSRSRSRLKRQWIQTARCARDQVVDIPIPFDFMSLMGSRTSAMADEDQRPVYVAKNGRDQYMLDYGHFAGYTQSFYDKYTMNTLYSCANLWSNHCMNNGVQPPKCKNLGYVGKSCKCQCPPQFTGTFCGKKVDSTVFPLLQKAHLVNVTTNTSVDFDLYAMRSDRADAFVEDFKFFQYFTIIINGNEETQRVNMESSHPYFWLLANYLKTTSSQDYLMNNFRTKDCSQGLMTLWGVSDRGAMRRECLSTFINNETSGPMLRSRTSHMDFILYSCFGVNYNSARLTIDLLLFKMDITFEVDPAKNVVAELTPPDFTSRKLQHIRPSDSQSQSQDLFSVNQLTMWIILGAVVFVILVFMIGFFICYLKSAPDWTGDDWMSQATDTDGLVDDSSRPWSSDDDYAS